MCNGLQRVRISLIVAQSVIKNEFTLIRSLFILIMILKIQILDKYHYLSENKVLIDHVKYAGNTNRLYRGKNKSDVSSERGQPSPQNEVIFGVSEKQLNFLSSKDISVKHGKVNKSMCNDQIKQSLIMYNNFTNDYLYRDKNKMNLKSKPKNNLVGKQYNQKLTSSVRGTKWKRKRSQ